MEKKCIVCGLGDQFVYCFVGNVCRNCFLSTPHGELETDEGLVKGNPFVSLSTPHGELETIIILDRKRGENKLSTPHGELETLPSQRSGLRLGFFQLHTVN